MVPGLRAACLLIAIGLLCVAGSARAAPCGGAGQRACCDALGEGPACRAGTIPVLGCSGDCRCRGSLINAMHHCVRPTCGGEGQRGCCGGAERAVLGLAGPCRSGLQEDVVGGCRGADCTCTGSSARSFGRCYRPTACGGPGQRACCTGTLERSTDGDDCNPGTAQAAGCSGDGCRCGGATSTGQRSAGTCVAPRCGGDGQRGCCGGAERAALGLSGPCQRGLNEDLDAGCSGADCACTGGGARSSGRCYRPTACGGPNQRACCTGTLERSTDGDDCNPGTAQRAGCAGYGCRCGGATSTGQRSAGTCVAPRCGGPGERGCCVGAERAAQGIAGACKAGLVEDTAAGCPGCACTDSALSSSGVCRVPACGGVKQRGCCADERQALGLAGACKAGLVEDVTTRCPAPCRCSVGMCGEVTPAYPVGTAWVEPSKIDEKRARIALSLYVAGLNHSRPYTNESVHKQGVDEMVALVKSDPTSIDNVVIALSESPWDDVRSVTPGTGPRAHCSAGSKIGSDGIPQVGECIAAELEKLFPGKSFTYTAWHWWDALGARVAPGVQGERGGAALITGPRWIPIASDHIKVSSSATERGSALEVRLEDRDQPGRQLSVYVMHAEDHDPDGTLHRELALRNVETIARVARRRMKPGDLAPLLVGDFNIQKCIDAAWCKGKPEFALGTGAGGELLFFQIGLYWVNHSVSGAVSPTAPKMVIESEYQLMHILSGTCGGALDFSDAAGFVAPVFQRFSMRADGWMATPHDGIVLPSIAHNVIHMGFEIAARGPGACPRPYDYTVLAKPGVVGKATGTGCGGRCSSGGSGGDAPGGGALLAIAVLGALVRRRRAV